MQDENVPAPEQLAAFLEQLRQLREVMLDLRASLLVNRLLFESFGISEEVYDACFAEARRTVARESDAARQATQVRRLLESLPIPKRPS